MARAATSAIATSEIVAWDNISNLARRLSGLVSAGPKVIALVEEYITQLQKLATGKPNSKSDKGEQP